LKYEARAETQQLYILFKDAKFVRKTSKNQKSSVSPIDIKKSQRINLKKEDSHQNQVSP